MNNTISAICVNCTVLITARSDVPVPDRVWLHVHHDERPSARVCDPRKPVQFDNVARPTISVQERT